ncbi:MAG: hypothetical protein AAGG01_10930 [Planctomycetota bacterium]
MKIAHELLDSIATELALSIERRAKVSAEYARDFARYSADYAAAMLDDPEPEDIERYREQALAVAETIRELNEQSIPDVVAIGEDAIRFVLLVLRAATIKA